MESGSTVERSVSGSGSRSELVSVIKSPSDKREYRGLTLENKVKVILISEPGTDKSAASMSVAAGKGIPYPCAL